jgi:hypothetical protein
MNKLSYLLSILLFWQLQLNGQVTNPPELDALLNGEKNYSRIINTVKQFYAAKANTLTINDSIEKKKIKRQLKMWTRWEKFNAGRLDENGDVVNVNAKDWELYQQMSNANNRPDAVQTSYGVWSEIGPKSYTTIGSGHNGGLGRVNCIGFHPTNASIFYVGCPAGGLWKTTNGGTSWTNIADHIPSVGVSGIVVSFNSANVLYILTGDGDGGHRDCIGILKSIDGGTTWLPTGTLPGAPSSGLRGYKLVQHPSSANILFAVTSSGIYKTTDAAASWIRVQSTGSFSDIEFKPGDPTIMYAARLNSGTPFYRSTNSGDTWSTTSIVGVPINASRIAIGVSANNANYVYLLAGPATGTGTFVGTFRSFDSGLNFDLRASTPNILGYPNAGNDNRHQTNYDLAIEVNPTNVAQILTGGINVWGSTNFAVTLTNRTGWFEPSTAAAQYVHADIHNLAYNPLNNRLYVCSDGGVSYSDDNGTNWTQIWNGLQIAQYYKMSGYSADQNRLIGGLQDNGTMYKKTASTNFDHVEGADGYSAVIDFTNSNIIYFTENDGVNKSTDGGTTAAFANLNGDCWPALAMHTTNNAILFAGRCDGVYKTINSAASWVNTGAMGESELITCPSNNQRVYALGGGVLSRSDNEATSWTTVSGNPGYPAGTITDIGVAPFNSSNVWISVGGYTAGSKVFQSTDGGANWTNRSGTLPNAAASAIAVDNAGGVYVGTDVGVFYREPSSGNWLPFYNWLPKTPITDIVLNETAGTIAVATFGRGVWRTDLYSACTPSLVLSGTVAGTRFYEASDNIVSTHVLEGGTGTEFIYRAGNFVRFDPGFEVKAGNNAKAFIGNCASGIPSFSKLHTLYGVTNVSEIINESLTKTTNDKSAIEKEIIQIETAKDGQTFITLNIAEDQYVQLYYQDETKEILAFLVKQYLPKGVYHLKVDTTKLKINKNISLQFYSKNKETKFPL